MLLVLQFIILLVFLTFLSNTDFFNSLGAFQSDGLQFLSQILVLVEALDHSALNRHSFLLLIIQLGIEPLDFFLQ